MQGKRTWPIAPCEGLLAARWKYLLRARNRSECFRESSDRDISQTYQPPLTRQSLVTPVAQLPDDASAPGIMPYGYRSFDRAFIFCDAALLSRARPTLWRCHSDQQLYFGTLLSHPLGRGPALTISANVPDLHFFRGSFGGRDVMPLYRDARAAHPNLPRCLLASLGRALKHQLTHEAFAAYVYAVLAHPAYTERFWDELETCEIRVPVTKRLQIFREAEAIGRRLIWLHTYGERFVPPGRTPGDIPAGNARCLAGVPEAPDQYPEQFRYDPAAREIRIGGNDLFRQPAGRFGPVAREVWDFEVSGLKVVQSWLGYRMRCRKGKKSSPLDDMHPERWTDEFTTEFLKLLWILEATVAGYPAQAELLDRICSAPLFLATDFPEPPPELRRAPSGAPDNQSQFELDQATDEE